MAKVIVLNGPPKCGKDTLAMQFLDYMKLVDDANVRFCQFKDALYRETQKIFSIPDSEMDIFKERNKKEVPNMLTNYMSPRQALIHVSETIIKPTHGRSYFGKEALKFVDKYNKHFDYFIFADGGFIEEVVELAKHHDVFVVRLHNGNMDFSGDSRRYLTDQDLINYGVEYCDFDVHVGRYVYDTIKLAEVVKDYLE